MISSKKFAGLQNINRGSPMSEFVGESKGSRAVTDSNEIFGDRKDRYKKDNFARS
jgi:hypothetical protein